ncbi:ABC transporter permease [Vallitalea longa]|uniref:ABC transporter permease n=1 Tax=Vallitalea longa TaxID=2936439 RepID=A0A9W5Y9X0_9FIRM|nr:ABC transporter permease [Vallitalea longa]GKX29577.1 ABC transporter permease [Vallitalea longa]
MKTTTKISISNLKYNRTRSILISIAIVLSSCLLMVLGTTTYGLIKYNKANVYSNYGDYQGTYARVDKDALEKMKHHAEFIDLGINENVATIEADGLKGNLTYMDQAACDMINIDLTEGNLPKEENEIVGQKEFFEDINGNNSIGDTVTIPYRIKGEGKIIEKDFIISGILPSNPTDNYNKNYQALVSRGFYDYSINDEDKSCNVLFNVLNEEKLNREKMETKIKDLAESLGIAKNDVIINTPNLMWTTNPNTDIIIISVLIGALIVLFSALVIYNIFYVGIINKVQEYGKIRAIGTTRKQLKKIIRHEGTFLGLVSIPIGIILGYIISNIMFEKLIYELTQQALMSEMQIISLFSIPIVLLVIAVSCLTIRISLRKPMKIASNVSPVEAMKYHNMSTENMKRKGYNSVNLFRLTTSDLTRNKKRTITTILTMGLSCILFVVVANLASSMNPEYDARRQMEKGDFRLELDCRINDSTYPENNLNHVQQQKLMGEDVINEIKDIDGVTKVETRGKVYASAMFDNFSDEEKKMSIGVFSREDYEAISEKCMRGNVDYDRAVDENGIIYTSDYFFDYYGFNIGDKLTFQLYDGDRVVEFDAVLQASARTHGSRFIMTEDTFKKLGFEEDITSDIFVYCKKDKLSLAGNILNNIGSRNKYYDMNAYTDILKQSKFSINTLIYPLYGLLTVLGIIGFMNMANTLITSIVTRKREFGILQAIGLTNKQLGRMLQAEGLVFTIGTLLISLTIGNLCGHQLVLAAREEGVIGVSAYHFPLTQVIIMTVVLVVMQTVLSLYMSKYIQKDALIDRIRYNN